MNRKRFFGTVGTCAFTYRLSRPTTNGTVAAEMREFVERTQADELMVVSHIYDQSARLRSYKIAAATMTESPARPS